MKVNIPGVAWSALVLGLVALLNSWLGQYVDSIYIPVIALVLNAIAKAVEIYFANKATENTIRGLDEPERSNLSKLFLG